MKERERQLQEVDFSDSQTEREKSAEKAEMYFALGQIKAYIEVVREDVDKMTRIIEEYNAQNNSDKIEN